LGSRGEAEPAGKIDGRAGEAEKLTYTRAGVRNGFQDEWGRAGRGGSAELSTGIGETGRRIPRGGARGAAKIDPPHISASNNLCPIEHPFEALGGLFSS